MQATTIFMSSISPTDRRGWLLGAALVALGACGPTAATAERAREPAAGETRLPSAASSVDVPAAGLPPKIDPASVPTDEMRILARDDVPIGPPGELEPGCRVTVRYPSAIDQDVTWPRARCGQLTIETITPAELRKLGQLDDLSAAERDDIAQPVNARMLYISTEVAAVVYPLNVAGIVTKVPIAD